MREDILSIVRSAKDITNAVILTHNIDFVFVQSIVIPALRMCGSPALTIFADADCAAQTYQYQYRVLSGLGRHYRVVPVSMKTGFRFHPKAVLLSGSKGATLLVGSGNLTFGGWKENGEVWFRYDTDADGTGPISGFRNYLREIVELCAEPRDGVTKEVEESFDSNTRSWASAMGPPRLLLGRAGRGGSLLEQMQRVFGPGGADHLYVCAPFFDEKAEAVRDLAQALDVASSTILVPSKRTNLLANAAATLGSQFRFETVTFEHKDTTGPDAEARSRKAWVHAKFYAVQRGDEVSVFAGSANCSRAALTIPGSAGNAELMTHATLQWPEFKRAFLDELVVDDVPPEFAAEPIGEAFVDSGKDCIRIRAARMDFGHIYVTYDANIDIDITHGEADDTMLGPVDVDAGYATFRTSQQPHRIVLVGSNGEWEVRSQPHWIDNEYALRTSARGRSLVDSIHVKVRDSTWGIGAWSDVLSEFYKHLQYMPKEFHRSTSSPRDDDKSKGPVPFEWGDVFAVGYGLIGRSGLNANIPTGRDVRIRSLRSMLLRWYGIGQPEPDKGFGRHDDESDSGGTGSTYDDGDSPDRITALPQARPRPTLKPASDTDRKRGLKIIKDVGKRLAEPEFLSERRPDLLAADLKVASILFRTGLAEAWISEQEFFDVTLAIWLPLFFNATGAEITGWLERRYLTAPKQREFAEAIRSVELAAALGCWALSSSANASSPEHALFCLASALGVARMPWLWQTGGNERIAQEIAEGFSHNLGDDDLDWEVINQRWLTLIRRGRALNYLGKAVSGIDLVGLRNRIGQMHIATGELLWQGPKVGFCITTSDCTKHYRKTENVDVLVLQQGKARKKFKVNCLIPVAGLLEVGVLEDNVIPAQAQRELSAMVSELRIGLAGA